ncbi:unnamed protein product [Zymoseptoria tritici ST99CH_3D1]|nr:unnamed protein product [Zymoseptoria tritici ST99CH_3D1]
MDQIYPIPAALLHSFPPILETLMETVRRIEQGQNETPPACCSCESTENTENLQRACPRSGCASYYCRDCLKTMFTLAVQEGLQFPAHCCGIIQIHTVLPDLDADVAKAYRAALEKYLSVKNVYCPVRTCSAFIPDRLIPIAHTSNSSGDRGPVDLPEKPTKEGGPVDLPDTFPCPACKASVCTRCYRVDHQPNACRDDGRREADEYESEMLTKFGYKQCPRCGEAVTRMFGCRHMRCRCGADFCWACLSPKKDCNGDCVAHESEEGSEPEQNSEGSENGDADDDLVQSPKEPANLDLNTQAHWENSGLDFGDDPGDTRMPQIWSCVHQFDEFMAADGEEYVECNRCFKTCPGGRGAVMCYHCYLLVCGDCEPHFATSKLEVKDEGEEERVIGDEVEAPEDEEVLVEDDEVIAEAERRTDAMSD